MPCGDRAVTYIIPARYFVSTRKVCGVDGRQGDDN